MLQNMSKDKYPKFKTLQEEFEYFVNLGSALPTQAADDMLIAYSLYKQAVYGDNTQQRPTENSNIIATFKHDAWAQLKGISKHKAIKEYIMHIKKLSENQ